MVPGHDPVDSSAAALHIEYGKRTCIKGPFSMGAGIGAGAGSAALDPAYKVPGQIIP